MAQVKYSVSVYNCDFELAEVAFAEVILKLLQFETISVIDSLGQPEKFGLP